MFYRVLELLLEPYLVTFMSFKTIKEASYRFMISLLFLFRFFLCDIYIHSSVLKVGLRTFFKNIGIGGI